ncbi:MAG TPA: hypothetical protein VJU81_26030 [Methylomirabilota bacterium]|nr:hypothetical protein [Methylomirabilota bacterium]
MNRLIVIVAIVGLAVGGTAGYLWWGLPAGQKQDELQRARLRAEAANEELAKAREQLRGTQTDLERERAMRARLEQAVTVGTK